MPNIFEEVATEMGLPLRTEPQPPAPPAPAPAATGGVWAEAAQELAADTSSIQQMAKGLQDLDQQLAKTPAFKPEYRYEGGGWLKTEEPSLHPHALLRSRRAEVLNQAREFVKTRQATIPEQLRPQAEAIYDPDPLVDRWKQGMPHEEAVRVSQLPRGQQAHWAALAQAPTGEDVKPEWWEKATRLDATEGGGERATIYEEVYGKGQNLATSKKAAEAYRRLDKDQRAAVDRALAATGVSADMVADVRKEAAARAKDARYRVETAIEQYKAGRMPEGLTAQQREEVRKQEAFTGPKSQHTIERLKEFLDKNEAEREQKHKPTEAEIHVAAASEFLPTLQEPEGVGGAFQELRSQYGPAYKWRSQGAVKSSERYAKVLPGATEGPGSATGAELLAQAPVAAIPGPVGAVGTVMAQVPRVMEQAPAMSAAEWLEKDRASGGKVLTEAQRDDAVRVLRDYAEHERYMSARGLSPRTQFIDTALNLIQYASIFKQAHSMGGSALSQAIRANVKAAVTQNLAGVAGKAVAGFAGRQAGKLAGFAAGAVIPYGLQAASAQIEANERMLAGETGHAAMLKAHGGAFLGSMAEQMGEYLVGGLTGPAQKILNKVPVFKRILTKLDDIVAGSPRLAATVKNFVNFAKQTQIQTLPAEEAEEIVERLGRATFGIDETTFMQALFPGWKQFGQEMLTLGVMSGSQAGMAYGHAADRPTLAMTRPKRISTLVKAGLSQQEAEELVTAADNRFLYPGLYSAEGKFLGARPEAVVPATQPAPAAEPAQPPAAPTKAQAAKLAEAAAQPEAPAARPDLEAMKTPELGKLAKELGVYEAARGGAPAPSRATLVEAIAKAQAERAPTIELPAQQPGVTIELPTAEQPKTPPAPGAAQVAPLQPVYETRKAREVERLQKAGASPAEIERTLASPAWTQKVDTVMRLGPVVDSLPTLRQLHKRAKAGEPTVMYFGDVNNMGGANEHLGTEQTDVLLGEMGDIIRSTLHGGDPARTVINRHHGRGDEISGGAVGIDRATAEQRIRATEDAVREWERNRTVTTTTGEKIKLSELRSKDGLTKRGLSVTLIGRQIDADRSISEVIQRASLAMTEKKRGLTGEYREPVEAPGAAAPEGQARGAEPRTPAPPQRVGGGEAEAAPAAEAGAVAGQPGVPAVRGGRGVEAPGAGEGRRGDEADEGGAREAYPGAHLLTPTVPEPLRRTAKGELLNQQKWDKMLADPLWGNGLLTSYISERHTNEALGITPEQRAQIKAISSALTAKYFAETEPIIRARKEAQKKPKPPEAPPPAAEPVSPTKPPPVAPPPVAPPPVAPPPVAPPPAARAADPSVGRLVAATGRMVATMKGGDREAIEAARAEFVDASDSYDRTHPFPPAGQHPDPARIRAGEVGMDLRDMDAARAAAPVPTAPRFPPPAKRPAPFPPKAKPAVEPATVPAAKAETVTLREGNPVIRGQQAYQSHRELIGRLARGEATAAELLAGFDALAAAEADIKAMLGQKTVKELPRTMRGGKKSEIIDDVFSAMLNRYNVEGTVTWQPFGGGTYRSALRAKVAAQTDADIQKARADALAEREAEEKALTNPETLTEFMRFVATKGEAALSAEQRVKYDELRAEQTKQLAEQRLEQRATVQPVEGAAAVPMEIVERPHTKRGHNVFIVTMGQRVSGEQFKDLAQKARRLGGNWSREWKPTDSPAGFVFNDRAGAEKFMALREGAVSVAAEAKERKAESQQNAAERLKQMADDMEAKANEALGRDRLVNTARRARMAGSADENARASIALAKTLRNLAEAIADGRAKHLGGIKARTHVELLDGLLRRAQADLEREQHLSPEQLGQPPTMEAVERVKYPTPFLWSHELPRLVRDLFEAKAGMILRSQVNRLAKEHTGEDERVEFPAELVAKIVAKLGDNAPWQLRDEAKDVQRLEQMGLTDLPTLRAALREYLTYRGEKPAADRAKALERGLAGTQIPGFFPTPAAVREKMMEAAGIEPGMSVLEPSAGKGDLADAAKEAGGEVDAVEFNSTLRGILEAKGYALAGSDFMEFGGKQYDRVVMNPPFENGQDIEHVRHAYNLLAPGGRVVAIMSEGPFFRSDKQATEFREWLESVGGTSEQLPAGSFEDRTQVRTTGVAARMVVIEKPAESAPTAAPLAPAPEAPAAEKQPWEMTREEYVSGGLQAEKPTTFTVDSGRKTPYGAIKIRFEPVRTKAIGAPAVKPIAVGLNGKEWPASASDIGGVVGRPFFTNETVALPYQRLKLWLDRKISDEDAANEGQKSVALQRTHHASVAQAVKEGHPVPAEVLADYPDLAEQPRPPRVEEAKAEVQADTETKYRDAFKPLSEAEGWPGDPTVDAIVEAGTLAGKSPQQVYDDLVAAKLDPADVTENIHRAFPDWPADQNGLDVDLEQQVKKGAVIEEHYEKGQTNPPERFYIEEVVERPDGVTELRGYYGDAVGVPAVLESNPDEMVLPGWHISQPRADLTAALPGMETEAAEYDKRRGLPPAPAGTPTEPTPAVQLPPELEAEKKAALEAIHENLRRPLTEQGEGGIKVRLVRGEPTVSGKPLPADTNPEKFTLPADVPAPGSDEFKALEAKILALEEEYAQVKPKKRDDWNSQHRYGPNGLDKMRERRRFARLASIIMDVDRHYADRVAALSAFKEEHDKEGGTSGAWEFVQAEIVAQLERQEPSVPAEARVSVATDVASSMFGYPLSNSSKLDEATHTGAEVWRNKQQQAEMEAKREAEAQAKAKTEKELEAAGIAKLAEEKKVEAAKYSDEVPKITVEDMRLLKDLPIVPTGFQTPEQWEEAISGRDRFAMISAGLMTEDGKLNPQGRRLFRAAKYRDNYLPFGLHEVNERATIVGVGDGARHFPDGTSYGTGTVRRRKFWTNTRSMWAGEPPKVKDRTPAPMPKGHQGQNMMEDAAPSEEKIREAVDARPIAFKPWRGGEDETAQLVVLETAAGGRVAIDAEYYDYGMVNYPGAKWVAVPDHTDERPVILVREKKGERELLGVVMPIRLVRSDDEAARSEINADIDAAKALPAPKAESGEFDAGARAALRAKYPKGPKASATVTLKAKDPEAAPEKRTVEGIEEVPGLIIARLEKGEPLQLMHKQSGFRVMYGTETNLRVAARFLATLPVDWTLETGDKLTAQLGAAKVAAMTDPIGGARVDVDFESVRLRPSEDAEVRAAWEKFDADNPGLIDMAMGRRIFPAGYTENVLKMKPEQLGSKNTVFTKDKIEQVRKERKKRGKTFGSILGGIDPLLIKQAFYEGGYWFEAGLRQLGAWLATMRQKYGGLNLTDDHLRQIWRDLAPWRRRMAAQERRVGRAERQGAQRAAEAGRRDLVAVGKAAQATIEATAAAGEKAVERTERAAERKATAEVKGVAKFVARQAVLLKQASDQEIAEFAKERLGKDDADVVVRLLPKIVANRGTLENRAKLIDWINEKADARRKQRAVASVQKALRNLRAGLTPEVQGEAGRLADTFSLTSHNVETLAAAKRLVDAARELAERSPILEVPPERIARAERLLGDIKKPLLRDLSTDEIEEIAGTLRRLAEVNSQQVADRMERLAAEDAADRDTAGADLRRVHRAERYKVPVGVRGELPAMGAARKLVSLLARFGLGTRTQYVFGRGETLGTIEEGLYDAQDRALGITRDAVREIAEEMEAQGLDTAARRRWSDVLDTRGWLMKALLPFRSRQTETIRVELPEATAEDRPGEVHHRLEALEMTRGERVFLLGMLRDPRIQGYLLRGAGLKWKAGGRRWSGTVFLTSEDMRAIWDSASAQEHAIAERMMAVYAKLAPMIEQAHLERTGVAPQLSRANWAIHRAGEEFERDPNEAYRQWSRDNLLPKDAGTLKERTGGPVSILVEDAFGAFPQHVALIANYVAKEAAMDRALRLLGDLKLRQDVAARVHFGLNYLGSIEETVKQFGGGGGSDRYAADTVMGLLLRGVHVSSLAYKPHVIIGQMVSMNKLQLVFDAKHLALGIARSGADLGARAKRLIPQYSQVLDSRINGEGFDLLTAGSRSRAVAGAYGEVGSALTRWGAELLQGSDNRVTYAAVEAGLAEGEDRGYTGEQLESYAVKRAARAIRDTQATADVLSVSPLMQEAKERPWMKLIPGMMFNTERNKTFNLLAQEGLRYRDSGHTAADKARLARAVGVVVLDGMLYRGVKWLTGTGIASLAGWLAYMLTGRRPPDEDEEKSKRLRQLARGTAQDIMGLYPVVGDMAGDVLDGTLRIVMGEPGAQLSTDNPLMGALTDVAAGYRNIVNGLKAGDERLASGPQEGEEKRGVLVRRGVGQMAGALGALAGVPVPAVTQVSRPLTKAVAGARPAGQFNHAAQEARQALREAQKARDAEILREHPDIEREELAEARKDRPVAMAVEAPAHTAKLVEDIIDRLSRAAKHNPEQAAVLARYADGAALIGAGLPLDQGEPSPFAPGAPAPVRKAVERVLALQAEHLSAAPPQPEAGETRDKYMVRRARWERQVELARSFFDRTGAQLEVVIEATREKAREDKQPVHMRVGAVRAAWRRLKLSGEALAAG